MTLDVGLTSPADGSTTSRAGSLCYACFTHVPLQFDYPPFVKTICLGAAQAPGRLNMQELAPRWAPYHPIIGGSVGSFALRNYILAHQPDARQVGICQYRKFMARYPVGRPGVNTSIMDVLTSQDVKAVNLADCMLPNDDGFLLVKPAHFPLNGVDHGYLYQYKDCHHIEDFLRFTAMAVELGVLDKQEVIPMFEEKIFMMGGAELGVYPADFWLPTVGALEQITWACLQRYDTRRDGAQARAWGFCMERLGSFLLLKHLRALGGNAAPLWPVTGHMTLVTEDGIYVPGT